jgi:flagellar hook assembly protein FlgD
LVLGQNRPNPFNPTTEISCSVPSRTMLHLRIWDVDGRMVRSLVDGVAEPGVHTVRWDGRDASGVSVPSGIYYYLLAGEGFEVTRTMALVK